MPFSPGDTLFLHATAPGDHGAQVWADAFAATAGRGPVKAALYYLGVRPFAPIPDTVPPGRIGQLIRLADGYRGPIAGPGPPPGPNSAWSNSIGSDPTIGITIWYTEWANGEGRPSGNRWPDGASVTVAEVPSDSVAALLIIADCNAAVGLSAGYRLIVPGLNFSSPWLFGFTWDLEFTHIDVDASCPGAGGGGGGGTGPPPPDSGRATAIETDGPHQWIHVGIGPKIQTFDSEYVQQFSGSYDVDKWVRFRCDARRGSLAALGRKDTRDTAGNVTASTFSVWFSADGGQTANKENEMAGTSALLERDSERSWILWFIADDTNQVSVAVSMDGGETYADPAPVKLDTGERLQAALLDCCQDPRMGGRVAMVCAPGADPAAAAATAILVSDDGGATFRKVA